MRWTQILFPWGKLLFFFFFFWNNLIWKSIGNVQMVSRSHLLENNVGRNLALSKLCNLISRRSLLHSCFTAIVHNISFPLLLALNSLSEYLMVSLRVLLPVDGPSAHHRGSFFSHSNSSLAPGIKLFHHDKNLPCLKNSYHHL